MINLICDQTGFNITEAIEDYGEYKDYIVYKDKHFINETAQKEYHKENCSEEYWVSDQVSSTCVNCGLYSEHPDL